MTQRQDVTDANEYEGLIGRKYFLLVSFRFYVFTDKTVCMTNLFAIYLKPFYIYTHWTYSKVYVRAVYKNDVLLLSFKRTVGLYVMQAMCNLYKISLYRYSNVKHDC